MPDEVRFGGIGDAVEKSRVVAGVKCILEDGVSEVMEG